MPNEEILILSKILWDYHHMNHSLKKADCIFVLWSHDTRVAEYAAELYLRWFAPLIIFSWWYGNFTKEYWTIPEAQVFANIASEKGIPKDAIIIEDRSSNTWENIQFTKEILFRKQIDPKFLILVQKPYMEKRTYATFTKQWPWKEFIVTSPQIEFLNYPNKEISLNTIINIMVGDLQRIIIYPQKWFQIFQEVPQNVLNAYNKLIKLGYTKHLII